MLLSQWRQSWFPEFKKMIADSNMKKGLFKFFTELSGAVGTCQSSSKQLKLSVYDMLTFSQIKAGALLKEVSCFDIRACIEEVVSIQAEQASSQQVRILTLFYGFPNE